MEGYNYEEDVENINIDNDRERHRRMVFKEFNGGVDDKKALLHAKRWDVSQIKGKILLSLGIRWKLSVIMGRRFF